LLKIKCKIDLATMKNSTVRKKISNNAFKWSKKNTFYLRAFMKLNKEILI